MKIVGATGWAVCGRLSGRGRFMGVRVGVANIFLCQSIDIDENIHFS